MWALRLVDVGVRLEAQVGLRGLAHVAEPGAAGVAGAGVDARQVDHGSEPSRGGLAEKVRHRGNRTGYNCVRNSDSSHSRASGDAGEEHTGWTSSRTSSRTGTCSSLHGDFDVRSTWEVRNAIYECIDVHDDDVVIDMTDVSTIDATALRAARRRHPPRLARRPPPDRPQPGPGRAPDGAPDPARPRHRGRAGRRDRLSVAAGHLGLRHPSHVRPGDWRVTAVLPCRA